MLRRAHPDLLALGLIVLLALVYFLPVLVAGDSAVVGSPKCDSLPMFYPFRAFVNGELQSGRLPLWTPHIFSGHPFHGEGQGAIFHPVNLLLAPLPPALALNLFALVHFAAIGLFFHLWMRSIGLGALAALLGALIFSLSSAPISRLFGGHFTNLPTLALVPALLWMWERWRAGGSLAWLGGGALAYGSLILAGHPQFLFYASVCLLWHVLFTVALTAGRKPSRALAVLGAAVCVLLVGVLIGAIQLLPSLAFARHSFRQEATFEFVSTYSFPPENFLTLLAPHFFGHLSEGYWGRWNPWEMWIHIGILPLALAGVAAARVRSRAVLAHALAVPVFAVLALGCHTPVLRVLYDHAPLFGLFRGSSKFILFSLISLCVLAAIGAERLMHPPDERRGRTDRLWLIGALALMAAGGIALLAVLGRGAEAPGSAWQRLIAWRFAQGESEAFVLAARNRLTPAETWAVASWSLWRCVVLAGLSVTAVGLWSWLRRHPPAARVALIALIVPDLWLFSFNQLETAPTQIMAMPDGFQREIARAEPPARVLWRSAPNAAMVHGWQTPLGYVGNLTARGNHLLSALFGATRSSSMVSISRELALPSQLHRANVGFVLQRGDQRPPQEAAQVVARTSRWALHRLVQPWPRASFSERWRIFPGEEQALADLEARRVDIRRLDLVETHDVVGLVGVGPPAEGDRIEFVETLPMKVTLQTVSAGPRLLVLMDAFDPDWRCTLDGETPLEILPVNIAFRGVVVPAGEHRVEFRYAPASFRWGLLATVLGLAAALGLLAGPRVAARGSFYPLTR